MTKILFVSLELSFKVPYAHLPGEIHCYYLNCEYNSIRNDFAWAHKIFFYVFSSCLMIQQRCGVESRAREREKCVSRSSFNNQA